MNITVYEDFVWRACSHKFATVASFDNDDLGFGLDAADVKSEPSSSQEIADEPKRGKKRQISETRKKKTKKKARKRRRQSNSGSRVSENDEEEEDEKKKGNKKKPKAKAKARAVGGRKTGKGEKAEEGTWKKWGLCKKLKDRKADFHQDQGNCKPCCAELRAFRRATELQGCQEKMQEMSRSDPQNRTKVLAAWIKERHRAAAVGEKVKFSIWELAVSLQSREGARHEGRSRMTRATSSPGPSRRREGR